MYLTSEPNKYSKEKLIEEALSYKEKVPCTYIIKRDMGISCFPYCPFYKKDAKKSFLCKNITFDVIKFLLKEFPLSCIDYLEEKH